MYLYIHIYVYICICIHSCICIWLHLQIVSLGFATAAPITYICFDLYTFIYTCVYTYVYMYVFIYMYVYMYIIIHIYIYTCILFYTYWHSDCKFGNRDDCARHGISERSTLQGTRCVAYLCNFTMTYTYATWPWGGYD